MTLLFLDYKNKVLTEEQDIYRTKAGSWALNHSFCCM